MEQVYHKYAIEFPAEAPEQHELADDDALRLARLARMSAWMLNNTEHEYRRGDFVENIAESGHRAQGLYIVDVRDGVPFLRDLDFENYSDYGAIPLDFETFTQFPVDYHNMLEEDPECESYLVGDPPPSAVPCHQLNLSWTRVTTQDGVTYHVSSAHAGWTMIVGDEPLEETSYFAPAWIASMPPELASHATTGDQVLLWTGCDW